jgi:hypothetical protein
VLKLPTDKQAFDDLDEIRLFSKCRNERLRLPAFLRHYRRLGVRRFFFADNASTDGTVEYLREQPDVHVFGTPQSFRAAGGGTDWLNALLARFGVGRWCVTVDVDELLCYPGSETTGLERLTQHLSDEGCDAMYCLLLDLYPRGPLRDASYHPGDELLEAAPLFDGGPYRRFPHAECPGVLVYGGVRERVFYPESRAGRWSRRLHVRLYYGALLKLPLVRSSRWVLARKPVFPPCLTKVPLVRWDEGSRYLNVNHFVSPKRVAPVSGVLLHFKLLQDFHARAVQEAARGEYYDGAIEFRRYAEGLRKDPAIALQYEGSVEFGGSSQLIRLGLMQDTESWTRARTTGSRT